MQGFQPYLAELEELARMLVAHESASRATLSERVQSALNGGPAEALRKAVSLSKIRASGAFFTGSTLAKKALRPIFRRHLANPTYCDPACGAGDLLLTCARTLPVGRTLYETLRKWGRVLIGFDVHPEFIAAARLRLLLLAMTRHRHKLAALESVRPAAFFPRLACKDVLKDPDVFRSASALVLNPPYTLTKAPDSCVWATGQVTSAALFLAQCVSMAKPGSHIVAILPDILRTGVRYAAWRCFIERRASILSVVPVGQFASWADVDVFILRLFLKSAAMRTRRHWMAVAPLKSTSGPVSNLFDISVGAVVPHRHKRVGKTFAYATARALPRWSVVTRITARRKFKGPVVDAPFVAVRRTSSPTDRERVVGTIVGGKRSVAVENHLLVFKPKNGSISLCRKLLSILRLRSTETWVNSRIRARHLTVNLLRELPWREATR